MKSNERQNGWDALVWMACVTGLILIATAFRTPAPYPQPNADDPICGDPVKWAREFGR